MEILVWVALLGNMASSCMELCWALARVSILRCIAPILFWAVLLSLIMFLPNSCWFVQGRKWPCGDWSERELCGRSSLPWRVTRNRSLGPYSPKL